MRFFKRCPHFILENKTGFTMVEALVSVAIFSFMSLALFSILLVGQKSWSMNSTKIQLQQELRKSMETMINDLRQAGNASITNVPADDNWYTTITFQVPSTVTSGSIVWDSNTIQYVLGGTGGDLLQRIQGTTRTVSQGISVLGFRRLSTASNILEVNIVALGTPPNGEQMDITLNFDVELRN